jgi:hypothetical protein
MNIFTFILFLISTLAYSQTEFKTINCTGKDGPICDNLKTQEADRVNAENTKLLANSLPGCIPIKFNKYLGDRIVSTTEVAGVYGSKCKFVINSADAQLSQICLLDRAAVNLVGKDPKTLSPEDMIRTQHILSSQCKVEAVSTTKSGRATKEEADALTKIKAEYGKLKAACFNGDKDSCQRLDSMTKEKVEECKKDPFNYVCKEMKFI